MKWHIPAKTFLLGEYAAIAEASAIVLTTAPCFEAALTETVGLHGIHEQSPAGLWWCQQEHPPQGLSWFDPYSARGGLGASSAQFIASYLASCHLKGTKYQLNAMLEAYYQSAWSGSGLRPSGYDIIAQSLYGCVFINKRANTIASYHWPFEDLSFLLLHTGVKLATHHHLHDTTLPGQISTLSQIVDKAREAFENADSDQLVNQINCYHHQLLELNLVAKHSIKLIKQLKTSYPEIIAIKGCGALGADVLLAVTHRMHATSLQKQLVRDNWSILATENNLSYKNNHKIDLLHHL